MTFLTTGNPLLDLGIALILGLVLSWLFVTRPLRQRAEAAEARVYETETELRTSHRELSRARDEIKGLHSKLTDGEEALSTARNQAAKAQSDLKAATDEQLALTAELETRANGVCRRRHPGAELVARSVPHAAEFTPGRA